MKLTVCGKNILALGISSIVISALVLVSGCVVRPAGRVGVEAGVVVAPPAVEVAMVPDDYYWDGYEYAGLVGDQYYYLGPGNAWVVCDPIRLGHVHVWEGGHPDWRVHVIHNDRYRSDSHGHYHPRRDNRH